ncbi:MAG: NfeD family protein [Fibrobacterota bacterium]
MKAVLFSLVLILKAGTVYSGSSAAVIPLEGEVQPGLARFIERATAEALDSGFTHIFYEINTFGGRVDAAFDISEIITAVPESITTVAFVKEKAISAGALIALSCSDLIMMPHTTLGDCAPIIQGREGPKMLGEKFQSPLRARFRAVAVRNGYPQRLAEAMVTPEIEVLKITENGKDSYLFRHEYDELSKERKNGIDEKKTVVREGELLTINAAEALSLGFSEITADNFEEASDYYSLIPGKRFGRRVSERILIFLNSIAPFLMLAGLAGVYMELKTPGLGLFGALGAAAFLLLFITKHWAGLADNLELVLFICGALLLAAEIFLIPGFGLAGAGGIIFIFAALLLSLQDFVFPELPWQKDIMADNFKTVSVVFLLSLPVLIAVLASGRIIASSPVAHKGSAEGFSSFAKNAAVPGAKGKSITPLRPSGSAVIEGERVNVTALDEYIPVDSDITVSEIRGGTVIVAKGKKDA